MDGPSCAEQEKKAEFRLFAALEAKRPATGTGSEFV